MGIVSFLGRIGSMIAPFTATVVGLLCYCVTFSIDIFLITCVNAFIEGSNRKRELELSRV